MFCCFILVHSFLHAKISHEPHPIKSILVHLLVNLNSTTSVPSKIAKNVGAEVHTDFGADEIGQKCGRRGQL